jgi:hypothetical protein
MNNLGTTDYIEGAAAIGAVWYGMKKSGWEKWALFALAAYFAYNVYTDYSAGGTST